MVQEKLKSKAQEGNSDKAGTLYSKQHEQTHFLKTWGNHSTYHYSKPLKNKSWPHLGSHNKLWGLWTIWQRLKVSEPTRTKNESKTKDVDPSCFRRRSPILHRAMPLQLCSVTQRVHLALCMPRMVASSSWDLSAHVWHSCACCSSKDTLAWLCKPKTRSPTIIAWCTTNWLSVSLGWSVLDE